MVRTDEAFVLGAFPLGDSDLIVAMLTRSHGQVRCVARAARRSRRRFGGALEPMTLVRARWSHREGRDLQRLDGVDVLTSHADMQSDPAVQAACAVFSEVTQAVCREEDDDSRTFRLLGTVLDALGDGLRVMIAVRYFEYWMLRLHGVLPDLSSCGTCHASATAQAFVSAAGEGLRCPDCARREADGGRSLSNDDRAFLAAAARSKPGDMMAFDSAARPGGALDRLLRGSLQAFLERPLKTYRHLGAAVLAGP